MNFKIGHKVSLYSHPQLTVTIIEIAIPENHNPFCVIQWENTGQTTSYPFEDIFCTKTQLEYNIFFDRVKDRLE